MLATVPAKQVWRHKRPGRSPDWPEHFTLAIIAMGSYSLHRYTSRFCKANYGRIFILFAFRGWLKLFRTLVLLLTFYT